MDFLRPSFLPEPGTVPNSVADGDYMARVRFVRLTGLLHLGSLLLPAGFVWFWLQPGPMEALSRIDTEITYLSAVGFWVLVAVARRAPAALQVAAYGLFAACVSAVVAPWLGWMHDGFPVFIEAAGWILASAWIGLALYNLFCGRDYSFAGELILVCLWVGAVAAAVTFGSDLTISEGLTLYLIAAVPACYWVSDLAMILRRRTHGDMAPAVMDLHRDMLNFVGIPFRLAGMARRRGKVQMKW
ncbi:MAG: Bax inhibitor-1 family protein [Armatimonadetes bacterium]|nr:Bax inhibitor-1 family protein [Armatimonadota bacterium]